MSLLVASQRSSFYAFLHKSNAKVARHSQIQWRKNCYYLHHRIYGAVVWNEGNRHKLAQTSCISRAVVRLNGYHSIQPTLMHEIEYNIIRAHIIRSAGQERRKENNEFMNNLAGFIF